MRDPRCRLMQRTAYCSWAVRHNQVVIRHLQNSDRINFQICLERPRTADQERHSLGFLETVTMSEETPRRRTIDAGRQTHAEYAQTVIAGWARRTVERIAPQDRSTIAAISRPRSDFRRICADRTNKARYPDVVFVAHTDANRSASVRA